MQRHKAYKTWLTAILLMHMLYQSRTSTHKCEYLVMCRENTNLLSPTSSNKNSNTRNEPQTHTHMAAATRKVKVNFFQIIILMYHMFLSHQWISFSFIYVIISLQLLLFLFATAATATVADLMVAFPPYIAPITLNDRMCVCAQNFNSCTKRTKCVWVCASAKRSQTATLTSNRLPSAKRKKKQISFGSHRAINDVKENQIKDNSTQNVKFSWRWRNCVKGFSTVCVHERIPYTIRHKQQQQVTSNSSNSDVIFPSNISDFRTYSLRCFIVKHTVCEYNANDEHIIIHSWYYVLMCMLLLLLIPLLLLVSVQIFRHSSIEKKKTECKLPHTYTQAAETVYGAKRNERFIHNSCLRLIGCDTFVRVVRRANHAHAEYRKP